IRGADLCIGKNNLPERAVDMAKRRKARLTDERRFYIIVGVFLCSVGGYPRKAKNGNAEE
ncbi:MAG: hypothetical protein DBX46_03290, partial [Clostridiales bacterium]